jgi:agmatinase
MPCVERSLIYYLQKVYISFDIDGLDPHLCPNTGTPVPGGLDFSQALFLIQTLVESGRTIIGFDLCEVGGLGNEWDGNVGARILYRLSNWAGRSNGLI